MTQERINSDSNQNEANAVEYSDKDVQANYDALKQQQQGKNRVSYGVHTGYYETVGKTVGKVKKYFGDAYSLPEQVVTYVDGEAVSDDYVLQDGQELDWQKETGVKGNEAIIVLDDDDEAEADDDDDVLMFTLQRLSETSTDPIVQATAYEALDRIQELESDILQIHKDYGCEIQDPAGTIWDHAEEMKNAIDCLPLVWSEGYATREQDGEWHLFRSDGEGILVANSFRELCLAISRWNKSRNN